MLRQGARTMRRIRMIQAFLSDESGATAIEYGLLAAGIALAIIAAVNTLGTTMSTKFNNISPSIKERTSVRSDRGSKGRKRCALSWRFVVSYGFCLADPQPIGAQKYIDAILGHAASAAELLDVALGPDLRIAA